LVEISPKVADFMRSVMKMFETVKDPAAFKMLTQVEVELEEDVRTKARQLDGRFSWVSDFTPWDMKAAKGHSPLDYFIASMPMCHQSHYSEESSVMGLTLNSVKIKAYGKFDIRPGIGYEEITYETQIESPESAEKIKELVIRAEDACFVTNTLKRALPISGTIYLNGTVLTTRQHLK